MIKAYYYLFYKLYKFSEAAPSRWMSELKASIAVAALDLLIITSIIYYFDISFDNGKLIYMFLALTICLTNYLTFHHKDQWKAIVEEYDKLPKNQNRVGGIIVWSIIFMIVINLIFSVYCMDLRARKNHTGPYSKEFIESGKQ